MSAAVDARGDLDLPVKVRRVLLGVAGIGCGIGPAFFGYFDMSVWGPIAIGLVAVAIALLVARQALPSGIAAIAILALLAFAAWCLLSMGWAESADRALTEGDRWILYGLFLLVLVLLVRDRRDAEILLGATVLGIVCIAGYDLVRMLDGEGRSLFGGSRLLEPLGYINGLGGYFLLGFWPLMAVAERARHPALAGLGAGGATVLATLVVLTDSRGTAFAFAASAVIVLALLPGRNRRAWALLAVLAGLALAWGPLTDVTRTLPPSQILAPPASTIEHGARWSLGVGLGVAFVWGVASWGATMVKDDLRARAVRFSAALLVAIGLLAVVAGLVAVKDPAGRISDQYEAFTKLEPIRGGSRFTSGGGNRYDYWRIAWNQFTDHPLDGIGAGNFDRTYFLERRTTEDVKQAHSIELQTLGETGLLGALLLGAFFVAVFWGVWRHAVAARSDPELIASTLAAVGILVAWLAQTSVDWLHLIPGLAGIALGAAAILLRDPRPGARGDLRRIPAPALAVPLLLGIVAIVFIGRPTLAGHLRGEAQGHVASDPRLALDEVGESLSLNPESVQAYYLRAAALARLGAYRPAKAALGEAIGREPHNYVSWALLGDLETRRGAISEAIHSYRRASRLNPRDRELRLLGSRRALVERLHRNPGAVIALPETGG